MSLNWLSTKKRSKQKRIEMVINFSLLRDEDYRAAWQGVRVGGGEIEEKRGGISVSLHTDKVVQLSFPFTLHVIYC